MAQLLGIVLLIAFAVFAFKVAILLLFLAGLIFRTKETIGLILVLGAFWLIRVQPIACLIVAAIIGIIALAKNAGKPPPSTDD